MAPYPQGQTALAHAIRDVLERRPDDAPTPIAVPLAVDDSEEATQDRDATTRTRPSRRMGT
jgi:hypothetical protein